MAGEGHPGGGGLSRLFRRAGLSRFGRLSSCDLPNDARTHTRSLLGGSRSCSRATAGRCRPSCALPKKAAFAGETRCERSTQRRSISVWRDVLRGRGKTSHTQVVTWYTCQAGLHGPGSRWVCHRKQNYEGGVSSSSSASSLSHSRLGSSPPRVGQILRPAPRLPTPILRRKRSWRHDPSLLCSPPRPPGRTAARGSCTGAAHSPGVYYYHRLRPTRPEPELDGDVHVPLGRSPGDVRVLSRRPRL